MGFTACWLIDRRLESRMATAWAYKGQVSEDMPTLRFTSGFLAGVGAALFLGWFLYRGYPNSNI